MEVTATVFEQATDMLWNPLVGPSLRSVLTGKRMGPRVPHAVASACGTR